MQSPPPPPPPPPPLSSLRNGKHRRTLLLPISPSPPFLPLAEKSLLHYTQEPEGSGLDSNILFENYQTYVSTPTF